MATTDDVELTIGRLKIIKNKLEEAHRMLESELRDCRNELCLKCGAYHKAHEGACDGCRWKDVGR